MAPASDPRLSAEHRRMLVEESGLSPEVIEERGYETVTSAARLRRLGFSQSQGNVPALLIPVHGCAGSVVLYQARPDRPRVRSGKPIKYETMAGATMALDVHPMARRLLGDPAVPLFITEGIKKGDSLVSRNCCAVALLGVWNWRGTNDSGGRVALADWEHVALNGRRVYIVFDSDVMTKTEVHAALGRLKGFLETRGGDVMLVYLPPGARGEKVGVDDYLVATHTIHDLLQLATPDLRPLKSGDHDDETERGYRSTSSGIIWTKPTRDGPTDMALTNFTATIVADVTEDDGAEQRRLFEIEGRLNGRTRRFRVPASQFTSMSWPAEHLGAAAIVYPGFGLKDHARAAIQILSGDVDERQVFAHTGWRRRGDSWVYLHSGGAIGAEGSIDEVEVALSGALERFVLPKPPCGEDMTQAIGASLGVLNVGPLSVMAPMLGAAYLAPLCDPLGEYKPDVTVWAHGPSGQFKSEAATLAQAHFGSFSRTTLPATFMSTANAIERLLFSAKDALVTVDDYHPAHDRRDEQAMAAVATRLLRAAGNGAGRGRMRADTRLRPDLPPRGIVLATGERVPDGYSTVARMFPVSVPPGAIDPVKLTAAQEQLPMFPAAMSGYVRWLAGRLDALHGTLPERFLELRKKAATSAEGHAREPGQVAHLYLGIEVFTTFAAEQGALSPADAEHLRSRGWAALIASAAEHRRELADESPAQRFLDLLADGFASKRAHLEAFAGGQPAADAELWGWERYTWVDRNGDEQSGFRTTSGSALLGRIDREWLLLLPEASHQFVAGAASRSGRVFPVELKTLLRRLDERGVIATESGGRRTVNVRVGGGTHRFIKLAHSALHPSLHAQEGEHREHREQGAPADSGVPDQRSLNWDLPTVTGNKDGEHSDSGAAGVPPVPDVPPAGATGVEEVFVL